MSKIWRVEEEQVMKAGKIIGINYTVWYKDENGVRTARRDYRHGHYKVIPMTVLNFILDENNEALTRYQEFNGNTYKRTTYQQPQEAPQEAPAEQNTTESTESTTTTASTEYHTPAYTWTVETNQNAEDAPQTAEQTNGAFTPRTA